MGKKPALSSKREERFQEFHKRVKSRDLQHLFNDLFLSFPRVSSSQVKENRGQILLRLGWAGPDSELLRAVSQGSLERESPVISSPERSLSSENRFPRATYLVTLLPLYCSFNIHLSKGKMLMCIIKISIVYE